MINLIVAVSQNGVIGKDGVLPWRLSEDLKTFKRLTMGGTLYVGKKTASTLPPLKSRDVRILNRNEHPSLDTIKNYHHNTATDAWIIGGASIYNAALELGIVDRVYLSLIEAEYNGDIFFSSQQFKEPMWKLVEETIIRIETPVVKLQQWNRVW